MNDDQLERLINEDGFDRARLLRLGAATLIVPAALGASARGAEAADVSRFATKGPWRVGRAGAGDLNDWMIFLSAHYDYAIKEKYKGLFKDYIVTAANFDPTKQVADVEDLLAQDIDLLFIEPSSTGGLVGAVRKAMRADVPVVLVSTRVSGDRWTTWVSRNNFKDGTIQAGWLAKKLKGKGQIVALMGFAGTSYATDVWNGNQSVLKKYPGIKVLEMQHADWSAPKAKKVTETLLVKHKQIDAVLSDGGQMALGAIQAFQDAGRPLPVVTADDWNGWMRAASKIKGLQFHSISGSANLSVAGVDLAVRILRGQSVPKIKEAPFKTWDQSQLKKWYRPDLVNAYWGFHSLPESYLKRKFALKKR